MCVVCTRRPPGGIRLLIAFARGAYCASVVMSLLNIPLDLPPDSPAHAAGHDNMFSGLAEWIGRCESPSPQTHTPLPSRRSPRVAHADKISRPDV